ncbi:MAG TPA: ABC transporter substrate-binding protein [Ilumatobacter sp.]|nr:ABC transporter substrate-binding protein [Ilumatobacter sp.]
MRTRNVGKALSVVAALSLIAAACGDDDDDAADTAADVADSVQDAVDEALDDAEAAVDSAVDAVDDAIDDATDGGDCEAVEDVSLQLQWFTQAQFAGYYAAVDQGFYEDKCLNVDIVQGGVDIVPHVQLANGDADFAISWVSKALAGREAGADITNIGQIFQRSGTLQVSFADSGITSPADFEGKKIGNWGFGNEYEIFAALGSVGLDPAEDVELVAQNFDMNALLAGEIDAAEAMTYNEYAQLLEAVNPDTGELYTPEDFTVVSYTDVGVGMLQDAIWADESRLAEEPEYRDQAVRFVAASMEGWAYCRDNVESCRDIVLAAGPALGASHQLWQMNEVNKLIWPSAAGIGFIDDAEWTRTVEISLNTPNLEGTTVLTAEPTDGAYTNDIVQEAWALLEGMSLDLTGGGFAPIDVELAEGGA